MIFGIRPRKSRSMPLFSAIHFISPAVKFIIFIIVYIFFCKNITTYSLMLFANLSSFDQGEYFFWTHKSHTINPEKSGLIHL